jgi:hypothetical protein
MGRRLKVDSLPEEARNKIVRGYTKGKTLRELARELQEEGYNVSHENIRRWLRKHKGTVDVLSVMGQELDEGYLVNALKALTVMALGLQSQLQYVMERLSSENITMENIERHTSLMNDVISNISRLTSAIRQSEKTLMELGRAFEETLAKVIEIIRSEVRDEELRVKIIKRIKDELQS